MPQSQKCSNCGLVNFAFDESCKRCKQPLLVQEEVLLKSEFDQNEEQTLHSSASKLFPCPDCDHSCSSLAPMCPNCGRVLQTTIYRNRKLILVLAAVSCVSIIAVYFAYSYADVKRESDVKTAELIGNPAKAGVSSKNNESARAALNAVGEIESVISVGANYQQYTSSLQSARIKYDAAMREFEPQDVSDMAIQTQLGAAFACHLDAAAAWQAFIKDGDEYGFLDSANYVVAPMESRYGFHSQDRQYFKNGVLQSIWRKSSENFESAKLAINHR